MVPPHSLICASRITEKPLSCGHVTNLVFVSVDFLLVFFTMSLIVPRHYWALLVLRDKFC